MGVLEAQHLTSHTALVAGSAPALMKAHGLQQLEDSDPPVVPVNHPDDLRRRQPTRLGPSPTADL